MRIRYLLALLLIGVTFWTVTLPNSAEARSQTEGGAGHFISQRANSTPSSKFKFVITVNDDGQGKGGGYQRASLTLRFIDGRLANMNIWDCDITIGMPLRTEKEGPIAPGYAAGISAIAVDTATDQLMETQPRWNRALFCSRYKDKLQEVFKNNYKTFGAKVEVCQ